MLKTIFVALLSFSVLFSNGFAVFAVERSKNIEKQSPVTLEKMVATGGEVAVDINMERLNGGARLSSLRFDAGGDSFTVIIANDQLRGPLPSSLKIASQNPFELPFKMSESAGNLVVEMMPFGEHYELTVRDEKTGYLFFNIEGHLYDYDASNRLFTIRDGRVLLSEQYAADLGRPLDAGAIVGDFSASATLRTVDSLTETNAETEFMTEGKNENLSYPDIFTRLFNSPKVCSANAGTVPGPDVVVGDVVGLAQFGSAVGNQVGLAVGTDSCNYGVVDLNWFANPSNDHPVIPQNLYRMSGGADNTERFEQIGQGQVKHAFTALTQNLCGLGCNGVGGSRLGSGCSDPYSAGLNAGPNLGSKAWINPFTGAYPRNDSSTPNNSHGSHTHVGTSHRILTNISDLNTSTNPGATYYAEAQYVTPHEYVWCQQNPTQCNMYNNVSYRRYSVSGTTGTFSFSPVGSTQRQKAAITAWTNSIQTELRPAPGVDGVAFVAYKVTNPSAGVWHYEYAIYNQNLDRAIQSFSIPLGNGITLTNVGFYAPPQHPGSIADGTVGDAGFSNAAWAQSQAGGAMTWSSETLAQNPNANAIRWGTMYNFRFDSNRPPQNVNATVGFFKTGSPVTVQVQGPTPQAAVNVSVSGRVLTTGGQGVGNTRVALTDSGGNLVAFAITNSFGRYQFDNVLSGRTYTVEPLSKRYTFTAQTLSVNANVVDLNFIDEANQ